MKNRRAIQSIADDLAVALKRESGNVIAIGDLLIEAKEAVNHGEWLPWLETNFGESTSTAENYMSAARLAAKFPTVANLKLRPTTLYLLGNHLDDGPEKLFSPAAIEAIVKAAEQKWVNPSRAYDIAQSLKSPPDVEESVSEEEIEDALPERPPATMPTPIPTASFNSAVATLARLQTKLLANFTATTHSPDQIDAVIAFLQAVRDSISKQTPRGVEGASAHNRDDVRASSAMEASS